MVFLENEILDPRPSERRRAPDRMIPSVFVVRTRGRPVAAEETACQRADSTL